MARPIPPRALGPLGERLAEADLARRGFRILARNERCRHVEFDLVARRGDEVVFVEVKARRSTAGGWPEAQVSARKLERMTAGALEYLERIALPRAPFRLVIAAILAGGDGSEPQLAWIEPFDATP
jgi:putative endonuclease